MEKVKEQLGYSNVFVDDKIAKISIVGAGMIDRPGIAATMFKTLADLGINIKMISTSEIKISCLVAEDKAQEAVKALHSVFRKHCVILMLKYLTLINTSIDIKRNRVYSVPVSNFIIFFISPDFAMQLYSSNDLSILLSTNSSIFSF